MEEYDNLYSGFHYVNKNVVNKTGVSNWVILDYPRDSVQGRFLFVNGRGLLLSSKWV